MDSCEGDWEIRPHSQYYTQKRHVNVWLARCNDTLAELTERGVHGGAGGGDAVGSERSLGASGAASPQQTDMQQLRQEEEEEEEEVVEEEEEEEEEVVEEVI
jgi:hypothetical protein